MSLPPGAPPGALELPPFLAGRGSAGPRPGRKSGRARARGNGKPRARSRQARQPKSGRPSSLPWRLRNSTSWIFSATSIALLDFCKARKMEYREAGGRCVVLPQPRQSQLFQLFERFEGETFGFRAGAAAENPDSALEGDLSKRGVDAYQAAYERYIFCAVCEPEDGWVTLLSSTLWASEVIRRVRPAVQPFDIYIARPQ